MISHLNNFDYVVIGIMALSCLFAFFRGLVREILSLAAWIGAGIVTYYYFQPVAEKLAPHFKDQKVVEIGTALGIYIAALVVFALINTIIIKSVKSGGESGTLDNLLGLMFGAARGALIISLGFFLLTKTIEPSEYPKWLTEAATLPYVQRGATLLAQMAPGTLSEVSTLEKKAAAEVKENKPDENTTNSNAQDESDVGYSKSATQQLDRLIQNTGQ